MAPGPFNRLNKSLDDMKDYGLTHKIPGAIFYLL